MIIETQCVINSQLNVLKYFTKHDYIYFKTYRITLSNWIFKWDWIYKYIFNCLKLNQ